MRAPVPRSWVVPRHEGDEELLVSVLIPTRERPALLRVTLASILAQTHGEFEVLVGMDAPTRGTRALARKEKDPKVQFFHYPRRRGPFPVYEDLFARSRGEAIVLFSDDDVMLPTFLERCVKGIESGADHVRTRWYLWDGAEGRRLDPLGWGAFNSSMYRRSFLEAFIAQHGALFDPTLRFYGDASFYDRLLKSPTAHEIAVIDEPLILYREHSGQLSRNPPLHSVIEYARSRRVMGKDITLPELAAYLGWTAKRRVERAIGRRIWDRNE